jgi:hypothetical protein
MSETPLGQNRDDLLHVNACRYSSQSSLRCLASLASAAYGNESSIESFSMIRCYSQTLEKAKMQGSQPLLP